jgi:endo-1,4-beta-xylanase
VQTRLFLLSLLSMAIGIVACGPTAGELIEPGSGGEQTSHGGTQGSGGVSSSGGIIGTGGHTTIGHGGSSVVPSSEGTGGGGGSGGGAGRGSGGAELTGGVTGAGGQAGRTTGAPVRNGGRTGTGTGGTTSGTVGGGGRTGFGPGTGGKPGAGGTSAGGSTSTTPSGPVDCSAAMPSGGTKHSGNGRGGSGNLAWEIWTNSGTGNLTTFSVPAFSASWGGTGDYLGRLGFEWGNSGKAYASYGTITADFTFKKSGNGGGFSYIGIYGWSNNPCVEYYILDDSMGSFPFNPYNSSQKGTATIDGETYKLFSNQTNGTGGSRCNQSSWSQFWSIRQKARQCGTITVSDHFKAWDGAGMKLGSLMEAKILVETGGGSGSVDFAIADMKTSQ